MFTPQRMGWKSSAGKSDGGKGKGVAGDTPASAPSPPVTLLRQGGGAAVEGGAGDPAVWGQFRAAGLLDEASLERKDLEAIQQKVIKLEKELYDYQYNMGLLLIEKKEWTEKYEGLRQALDEAQVAFKREHAAHSMAFADIERREDNLRKALGVEKQCVADLEKALHDLRSESAGVKFGADQKMADALAMVGGIEEKSLEVESKLRAADAKLAEASRKSAEIDRKLKEVESRGNTLQMERLSFSAEKEAHESALLRQKEELRDWETKLHEGQKRLSESQGLLGKRESRLHEIDRRLIQKEKDLEEFRRKIEASNIDFKEKEIVMCTRLADLGAREEEVDVKRKELDWKRQQLIDLEKELDEREKVAVEKLVEEHKAVLDEQKKAFELEMDQKRVSLDEDMKNQSIALGEREVEVVRKEDKIVQRENILDGRDEKLKEKEKDYDSKLKALKDREKILKAEEKTLEMEKKRQETDKQELLSLRTDFSKDVAAVEVAKQQIMKDREKLEVIEKERLEVLNLQAQLRAEIEESRLQKELALKEREDLKQEKDAFEKKWEELDEEKVVIDKKVKEVEEEKRKLSRWKEAEEDHLNREKMAGQEQLKREVDALELEKIKFTSDVDEERAELTEKARSEHCRMLQRFEDHKHEFEVSLRREYDQIEQRLQDKITVFEREKAREMNEMELLRKLNQEERDTLALDKKSIDEEKLQISEGREDIERNQVMIKKDIEELSALIDNVKLQRQKLVENSSQLRAFVEQNKNCNSCGEAIISDVKLLMEIEDDKHPLPRQLTEGYLKETLNNGPSVSDISLKAVDLDSGGRLSWLKKCTAKIFSLSPVSKVDSVLQDPIKGSVSFDMDDAIQVSDQVEENGERQSAFATGVAVDDTVNENITLADDELAPSLDEKNDIDRSMEIVEDSALSENVVSKIPTSNRRGKKGGRLRTTRSVKQVIEEAERFLGKDVENNVSGKQSDLHDGHLKQVNEDSQNHSLQKSGVGKKRQHKSISLDQEADETDARSESIATGGRKRRHTAVVTGNEAPGAKRYNLRNKSTVAGPANSARQSKGRRTDHPRSSGCLNDREKAQEDSVSGGLEQRPTATLPVGDHFDNETGVSKLQTTQGKSVLRACSEISSQFDVRVEAGDASDGVEVNGRQDLKDGYETEEADNVEESEDGSPSEKHNASIGKKLWTFFTT